MTTEPSPCIAAHWIGTDLRVDDFEAPAWQKADPVSIARFWSGEPAPGSKHAEAHILWSDQALHVRYTCNQFEPPIVSSEPQMITKTIGLWDRDVCEIFLAPDLQRTERYFEFEAAPTGEWVDLGINWRPEGRVTDWEFNSGMTTASHLENTKLVLAMRIPWKDGDGPIHKPQRHELWRVNLFRCVGIGDSRYLAWQPTFTAEPNFHVPQSFGWLRFD